MNWQWFHTWDFGKNGVWNEKGLFRVTGKRPDTHKVIHRPYRVIHKVIHRLAHYVSQG